MTPEDITESEWLTGKDRAYFDPYGLIVQLTGRDGGDSCQRMGMFYYALARLGEPYANAYSHSLDLLEHPDKPGIYRRHPDPSMWYSDWDRFSRDQATPLVICMGELNFKSRLWDFFKGHVKRWGFMTNTRKNGVWKDEKEHQVKAAPWKDWDYKWKVPDLCGPEFFGLYIRAFKWWWLYPLLLICDLETFAGSISRRFSKDKDVLNHVMISHYATTHYPTPIIWLANLFNDENDLLGKMNLYFDGEDPAFFVRLYTPLIKEL